MSKGKGWLSRLALALETTYGTAVTVAELIPYLTEGISFQKDRANDKSLTGDAGFNRSFVGVGKYVGPLKCNLAYGDLDIMIAAALGATAGVPVIVGIAPALYSNTYSLADEINHSFTLAADKAVSIHEWAGCKINKLTLRGTPSNPIEAEFEIVAKTRLLSTDAAYAGNDAADITAATELDVPVVMFEDLVMLLGDNVNALVAPTDNFCVGGFELVIDNHLRTDEQTNCGLDEPERNERREIKLTLDFPSYSTNNYIDWLVANTILQSSMTFTRADPLGVLTDDYQYQLRLGKMLVAEYPTPVEGDQMIAPKVVFDLLRVKTATDNPTWVAMTDEMELYTVGPRVADPLA